MKNLIKVSVLLIMAFMLGCGGDTAGEETGAPRLVMSQVNYNVGDEPSVTISGALSGDRDWVGIYPKASNNEWVNVIMWNYAVNGVVSFDEKIDDGILPAGEYEARLFFHNSYQDEAKVGFSVTDGTGAVDFADYGAYDYQNVVGEQADTPLNLLRVYKPKMNGEVRQNAPVVVFSTGGFHADLSDYEEMIKFIVSKGYLVIGVATSTDRAGEFARILTAIDLQGDLADTSKIGVLGNSTGGGTPFYNLKNLKDHGYANDSFIISLDGWFALGLPVDDVKVLNTTTLLLQFGGADGLDYNGHNTNDGHYQDPRILMSLYNILPGNEKSLSYLDNDEHGYPQGSMDNKADLRRVVGAMLAYKFENGGQAAKDIVLNNGKYNEIDNAKVAENLYHYGCNDDPYNYCDVNNPTQAF